jgi:hypothetical protein
MNTLCAKLGILTAVAALVTGLSISVNAAEKKSFKWTYTARETVSESPRQCLITNLFKAHT